MRLGTGTCAAAAGAGGLGAGRGLVRGACAGAGGAVVRGAGSAQAATRCTGGGPPAAPTGSSANRPGLTAIPSPTASRFKATGPLAGGPGCSGKLTFIGEMNAGSTCGLITFQGAAIGLPGVARFAGFSASGIAPARLYDRDGNIVGSENAQFLTNAPFSACNEPGGLTQVNFSSVIELFG